MLQPLSLHLLEDGIFLSLVGEFWLHWLSCRGEWLISWISFTLLLLTQHLLPINLIEKTLIRLVSLLLLIIILATLLTKLLLLSFLQLILVLLRHCWRLLSCGRKRLIIGVLSLLLEHFPLFGQSLLLHESHHIELFDRLLCDRVHFVFLGHSGRDLRLGHWVLMLLLPSHLSIFHESLVR